MILQPTLKIGLRSLLVGCFLGSGCGPANDGLTAGRRIPVSAPSAAQTPDAPVLKQLEKGRYYVRKPWTVELDGRRWVVPRGYHSNGITAPKRIKRSLGDGVDFPETWAAIFHDWLFTQPGVNRAQADKLFYDLLVAYGVPQRKAHLMYASVSAYSRTRRDH